MDIATFCNNHITQEFENENENLFENPIILSPLTGEGFGRELSRTVRVRGGERDCRGFAATIG